MTDLDGRLLAAAGGWLAGQGIGNGVLENPVVLQGGTQNILIRFTAAGRDLVLRRPPKSPRPRNNELLLREATVLRALGSTPVPHPRLVAVCEDTEILGGAVFYIMEAIDGFNPAAVEPARLADRFVRDRIAFAATDILADIGALDHESIGLSEFGRPEGFLERQVGRWSAERDAQLRLNGYPGEPLPGYDVVREYLDAERPDGFRAGLMHGDYHVGNLIVGEQFDVRAVIDWEMSTVGDPLLDLGRFLALWPDEHEVIVDRGGFWTAGPLPGVDELAERYARRRGIRLDHLDWYIVMGCFKLGVVLEGTYARACAGQAPLPTGELLHTVAVRLFRRAARLAGSSTRSTSVPRRAL
ncbi:phosphotransferase family protein [Nocardia vinacea]|uniref:Phosphotransferase family protein n=1 Tax=Nocardia vinacea TaxID=96468 RepID=A0ABZ1YX50_9NOCA|nr:phosphotransferase family protein [Nocardia vinacea]